MTVMELTCIATPISPTVLFGATATVVYTPLYNNVTYSCIQGGYYGEGNIDSDPCFVDDANDNYHLSPNSPCIDKGDPDLITGPNETDIDGDYRVIDGDANYTKVVDMVLTNSIGALPILTATK